MNKSFLLSTIKKETIIIKTVEVDEIKNENFD